MARLTYPIMLRVVRQIEQNGATDLFDYLTAYRAACDYMGEFIPGPFSHKGYQERLLAIALAAYAMKSELREGDGHE